MEWIDSLKGEIVGLDTAPLIYYIEEHPVYLESVRYFFEAVDRGNFKVVTSTITLLEVLVQPFRYNNITLAEDYRSILLNSANVTTVGISESVAEQAASLRAQHNIRTPDAIQLAAAIQEDATFFLTNDSGLPKLSSLSLLVLDDLIRTPSD
ncbi:MAG: PIN domain-containing protein [Deltaproteobacteria bacterium]|nr:PIN domain-containing protein [Deltaproteobacteria bacterium]